jgi:hypothetical protein
MEGPMALTSRYAGKPMLRLLECYVLWAIGMLERNEKEKLSQMEPKLRQVFKQPDGDWRQIVSRAMAFPAHMPDLIRVKWAENSELSKRQSAVLAPQEFAQKFVDANLVK